MLTNNDNTIFEVCHVYIIPCFYVVLIQFHVITIMFDEINSIKGILYILKVNQGLEK